MLHLKSILITVTVISEIGSMRKVLSFQNMLGACYRIGIKLTIHRKDLNHVREIKKRGYCSLSLTEKL